MNADKAVPRIPGFSPLEWSFDTVPDSELVACCYWEYARESAFIRDVRRRCLDPKWREMMNSEFWDHCGADIERIQSIGYPAEVFLRGFFFDDQEDRRPKHPDAPRITGAFPAPWQSLTPGERAERASIRNDINILGLQPFKRANWSDAFLLAERAKERQREVLKAYDDARAERPGVSEHYLRKWGVLKEPPPGLSIYWAGDDDLPSKELTMVEIEWAFFTNDQIVEHFRRWVKENRPKEVRKPDGRGHKPNDWRANLTRLAAMRLLSRCSATELVGGTRFPEVWKTRQFGGKKWEEPTKWRDARREAGALFRKLFPFLPKEEKPLSWLRRKEG